MVAVVLGVLVTVSSLMLGFFLAVSNISFIVENDFITKAKQNAVLHALTRGQLAVRAKVLTEEKNETSVAPEPLREFDDGTKTDMTYNITYDGTNVDAQIKIK